MLFTIKFESFDRNRVSKRKTTCLEYGSLLVLDNDFCHHQLVTQICFIWFRMKGTWSILHMIKTESVFSRGIDIFPILWYKQKIKKMSSLALSICLSVSLSPGLCLYLYMHDIRWYFGRIMSSLWLLMTWFLSVAMVLFMLDARVFVFNEDILLRLIPS